MSYPFKRDTGFFSGGLLSGILTILLLLYFGGGPYALRPITFVADRKAKERYLEDRKILEEIRNDPGRRPQPGPTATYEVRSPNVNMRICPGLDCEPIYTLQPGMQIADTGGGEFRDGIDWIRVSVNGREGWVSRRYLHIPGSQPLPPPPPNTVGANRLRVRISDIWLRECPGLNCREIEPLPLGALVADMGQSTPVDAEWWIKIRYGSRAGWVIRNTLE
jgi:Bacterial SH3 domain